MRTIVLSVVSAVVLACMSTSVAPGAGTLGGKDVNLPRASSDNANRDQDNALDAVKSGKAKTLAQIVQLLGKTIEGRIIDARLISDGGFLLYDLTVVSPDGEVRHFIVDARTGQRVK